VNKNNNNLTKQYGILIYLHIQTFYLQKEKPLFVIFLFIILVAYSLLKNK